MKAEKKNKFFNEIAIGAGVIDLDLIKKVYYAFVRTSIKTMVDEGECELPDLGIFHISERKGSTRKLIYMKEAAVFSPYKTMHFKPCLYLKDHINKREPHYNRKAR